jgi:hypothetical protein
VAVILANKGQEVLVDDEDFAALSQNGWYVDSGGYAARTVWGGGAPGKKIYMHRVVVGAEAGGKTKVDHINGNKLDNRRSNLRECSHKENIRNQKLRTNNASGVRGVALLPKTGKWRARIMVDYKERHLGTFETKEQACDAYRLAAARYHGEFARIA